MASDICVRVGRKIKELRQAKGWSQQLLADHAELERAHLSRLEDGRREAGLTAVGDAASTVAELGGKQDRGLEGLAGGVE